ncbi:hypothetical protein B5G43_06615 [Flavonifractor sp. An92]|uniref:hypothetical protein n=1 Tax=Flavonifractor sp. An92 TaxID=1965666 RepID=UPI000B37339A|nr:MULTISPECIES: hypothetical protein [unclassified Flavonifractor]OUN06972.1 hypothetical protein B5G43_06615 [Flavonifractor sp. An92]OUQ21222.1 hypothetical protein B5E80_16570 [Flavonifractor sp. An135]
MRRRTWAACLLAAVLLVLVIPLADASEPTVYQLALNDTFMDEDALVTSNMPVSVRGTIYVPYSTFDRYATGVDLGVSYTENWDNGEHTLTLFTLNGLLCFNLTQGTCIDQNEEPQNMSAVMRNNKVYVPAYSVCQFFGLQYSYIPTRTAGVLIRIKNQNAVLNDVKFQQSSASFMQNRYNKYILSLTPSATPSITTPRPPVTPTPTATATQPVTEPEEGKTVRLAVSCTTGEAGADILETLSGRGVQALVLFRPAELEARADLVLQALAEGHTVGLLVDGSDAQDALEELEAGNALLARLAWTQTHIACVENGTDETLETLRQAGWRLWEGEVDGRSGSGELPIASILNQVGRQRTSARVDLDDSAATGNSVGRLISRLLNEKHTLAAVLESDLS